MSNIISFYTQGAFVEELLTLGMAELSRVCLLLAGLCLC